MSLAIIGATAAVAGVGLTTYSASQSGSAASDAASAQNNATAAAQQSQANATAEQKREFDLTQSNFAPYKAVGDAAAPALQQFNATGGGDMTQDPLYKNAMGAATRQATQQSAGSGQGTAGGALQTRLAQLGNQVYNNTYATKYQQLTDAIKVGQGAAGSISTAGTALGAQSQAGASNLGSLAQSGAVNLGNIATNNANTQAGLYGGMANTIGGLAKTGAANGWWGSSAAGAPADNTAGGANFSGNVSGSGTVDNYGDPIGA
jgi:hypothetical protein